MAVILRIIKLYWRHRRQALLAYLCMFTTAGMALAIPRLIGQGIDLALNHQGPYHLSIVALLVVFAGTFRALASYGQNYLSEYLSEKCAYELRNALYVRLQNLSYAFHDRAHTGQLMSRATADVDGVRLFIGAALIRGVYYITLMTVVTVILVRTNWQLAALSLFVLPIISFRTYKISKTLRRLWMNIQQKIGELGDLIQENIVGAKVVRAFAREEYEKEKFGKKADEIFRREMEAYLMQANNTPLMNFLFMISTGAILWYGGVLVMQGALTAGGLTQFLLYLVLLSMPVRILSWIITLSSRAISCGERIFEIIDTVSPVEEKPDAVELDGIEGAVRFSRVSFSYGVQDSVLRDVDFDVAPGKVAALVGMSGSGKSTIANLIPRFYDVTEGAITIDGVDIRKVTLSSLRRHIGIVHQDAFLFSATIAENIRYGKPDATMEEIMDAAKAARLHDFIEGLPDGYETLVGERGITLSGGQKQRLAIARTILLNPRILIMDDSTSSVDTETEYFLRRSLRDLLKNRTTFIIAQRLTSVKMADIILVLEDGRLSQKGVHEDLIKQEGPYRKLYELQFGAADKMTPKISAFRAPDAASPDKSQTAAKSHVPANSRRLKDSLDLSDDMVFGKAYDAGVMMRLLQYLMPHKRQVGTATAAMLVHTATGLAIPFIIGSTINKFVIHKDFPGLHLMMGLFFLNAAVNWAAYYVQIKYETLIGQKVLFRLRTQIFSHLQRLSIPFFEHNETGRIISRVQNDTAQLEEFIGDDLLAVTGEILSLGGIIAVLVVMDWRLSLITFLFAPLLLVFIFFWQKRARTYFMKVRQAIAAVNAALQESIAGIRVIQSLSREDINAREFDKVNDAHFHANLQDGAVSAAMMPAVEIVMALSSASIIYFGGAMVARQTLEVGTLIAFALYIQRFFEPIRTLALEYAELQRAMASGSRVFELLDVAPEVKDLPDAAAVENLHGEIRFDNVSFSYVPGLEVLHGINLTVKPGQTVALIGPTGAGKSTLLSLIMRYYDATAGRVLIDGRDIRNIRRTSLLQHIGLAPQDPFLFSGTVKENIRYGRLSATDDEIIQAAKTVNAHAFIMRLEKGYDTVLQERGQNISMGQRQLISFARAVLVDPAVILLDEATANVDSYNENLIRKGMTKLLAGRTALIIAHRLSTIRNADRIIVLDNGRIMEEGGHERLMSAGGLYARLNRLSNVE